jgi:hypothetical protein
MSSTAGPEFETIQRQGMITLGTSVWFRSEQIIDRLRQELIAELNDQEQKDAVANSYERLSGIAHSLLSDTNYMRTENPFTFKDYMEDLKNVLKMVYECVPLRPGADEDAPDNIDFLKRNFYDSISAMCGFRFIPQVYVPITQVVRFLRNVEEHGEKPVDHITGKRSYGNLYVLMSIFVLITYAYKEVLQTWLEALQRTRPRR